MTHPLAGYGCIICASEAVVASITVERNGVLAHYPACAAHIEQATMRVAQDQQAAPGRLTAFTAPNNVIDVGEARVVERPAIQRAD